MRLSQSHVLPVPLDQAWAVLNDVTLLRQALPGCETLLEIAQDEFVAEMAVPFGTATSRFTVYVRRHDIEAPIRCTLHFETRTAGVNGSGSAALRLALEGQEATSLQATIEVGVDGVIGMLAAPLIELTAQEMARQFFDALGTLAGSRRVRAPAA
jgi:carbon monoxide dehydrogenase subunit G